MFKLILTMCTLVMIAVNGIHQTKEDPLCSPNCIWDKKKDAALQASIN